MLRGGLVESPRLGEELVALERGEVHQWYVTGGPDDAWGGRCANKRELQREMSVGERVGKERERKRVRKKTHKIVDSIRCHRVGLLATLWYVTCSDFVSSCGVIGSQNLKLSNTVLSPRYRFR